MPKRDITIVRNSVESVYGFLDYLDRNVPGASKYTKYIKLEFVQNSKAIWFVDANNNRVTVNVLYSEYKADIQHLERIYEKLLHAIQYQIEGTELTDLEFSGVSYSSIDNPKTYKDLLDQAAQIVTTWMLYVDEVMDTE
jgi:NAD-specific glutamate dehydrogenase